MAYYTPYQSQYHTQLAQAYTPPAQQNQNGIIWVQGIEAAKAFMILPNTTVLLMDSDSSKFYLKSADASGMPLLRIFEYSEITQNAPRTASEAPSVDLSTFATKAEFEAFRDEINGLLKNVSRRRTEKEVEPDA